MTPEHIPTAPDSRAMLRALLERLKTATDPERAPLILLIDEHVRLLGMPQVLPACDAG
jgi:hypothetical protein